MAAESSLGSDISELRASASFHHMQLLESKEGS